MDEAKRKLAELEKAKDKALKNGNKDLYSKAIIDVAQAKANLKDLEDAVKDVDKKV